MSGATLIRLPTQSLGSSGVLEFQHSGSNDSNRNSKVQCVAMAAEVPWGLRPKPLDRKSF